jgi:hypothetical protein
MSSKAWERCEAELLRIAKDNGGVLTPQAVVEAASASDHPLHGYFEWDDNEAARLYRDEQARRLIRRVYAVYESDQEPIQMRALVSLVEDRLNGDSYRLFDSVMAAPALRQQYVEQCLRELNTVRRKYAAVSELSAVWSAIDQASGGRGTGATLTTDVAALAMAAD